MPADYDIFNVGKDVNRVGAAIMFMGAGTNAYDAFSAVNSSPWTAESFGGDPDKEKSLREYVLHALVISSAYAIMGSVIAKSPWPVLGAAIASVYMYWLYMRAISRAQAKGSEGWGET